DARAGPRGGGTRRARRAGRAPALWTHRRTGRAPAASRMTGASVLVAARPAGRSTLAWRLAIRELRGGLRGFYVFIACTALGVTAIAGVGSLARSLADGLAHEGRVILGGDAVFPLVHREAHPPERALLESKGRVSVAATMRAMARTDDGRAALIEIKAVDDAYPLYGAVRLNPDRPTSELLSARNGVFGAVADPVLLARLDLAPGARIRIGESTVEIRASLEAEPDKLATRFTLRPRLLMSQEGLRATGLLQPGSLVRWNYRLRLFDNDAGDRATAAAVNEAHAAFPDAGWEIRTRDNASPELGRSIARFTQFLTLVGLTSLLVGGVGVANAVKSYLDRKRDVIATLKRSAPPAARSSRSISGRYWRSPFSASGSGLRPARRSRSCSPPHSAPSFPCRLRPRSIRTSSRWRCSMVC